MDAGGRAVGGRSSARCLDWSPRNDLSKTTGSADVDDHAAGIAPDEERVAMFVTLVHVLDTSRRTLFVVLNDHQSAVSGGTPGT
jgi:hypothetical protein